MEFVQTEGCSCCTLRVTDPYTNDLKDICALNGEDVTDDVAPVEGRCKLLDGPVVFHFEALIIEDVADFGDEAMRRL